MAPVMPIAANNERFAQGQARDAYRSDYCFTAAISKLHAISSSSISILLRLRGRGRLWQGLGRDSAGWHIARPLPYAAMAMFMLRPGL